MKCTVKKIGDYKVFDVDGKTVYPGAYMSYAPLQEDIDEMKEAGIKLFMFGNYAGDEGINAEAGLRPFSNNFFKGYGKYDFSFFEKIMTMIAPIGNEDVHVITRVCIEPPKWWQKENVEETGLDYEGNPIRYCFTSEKWRKDMSDAIKAFIDHVENSKWKNMVIGYHIAAGGTEEWPYQHRFADGFYDYSETNRSAYIKWLENKYVSPEKLSDAWSKEIKNFSDVKFPSPAYRTYSENGFIRDPETEKDILDFHDFHNFAVADTINYFCKEVKEYTNYERITGVFYGYTCVMSFNKKGAHALYELLDKPYVDFISTTNIFIGEHGAWVPSAALESLNLHDKMYLAEGDMRMHLSTNMGVYLPHALPDNDYYTSDTWKPRGDINYSLSVQTKALARTVCAKSGLWWQGMFGRWYADERMMEIVGKTEEIYSKQQNDYLKADVCVLVDEKAYKYYASVNHRTVRDVMCNNMWELSHAGFDYHLYLLSDITNDKFPENNYKMFIFVGAINPTDEEKDAINKKLKNNNKTLLWLGAASCYDKDLNNFALEESGENQDGVVFENNTYYDINPNGEKAGYMLPNFRFSNEKGYTLAKFENGDAAVMWKEFENYNSVHSLSFVPSAELYQHIANLSGAHIYNRTGDCIIAGGEYVAIIAVKDGYRRISLPERGFNATNAITGEAVSVNECFIDMKMKENDTILLHLEKRTDGLW